MTDAKMRKAIQLVALLNLAYFGFEFAVAISIGSVSLFADSIDFLEDASVNLLILLALGWSAMARSRVGMALAVILARLGLQLADFSLALSFWKQKNGGYSLQIKWSCLLKLVGVD